MVIVSQGTISEEAPQSPYKGEFGEILSSKNHIKTAHDIYVSPLLGGRGIFTESANF